MLKFNHIIRWDATQCWQTFLFLIPKCGDFILNFKDGDGNSSGSTGSSEGENVEEFRELGSENVTLAHETENDK